MNPLKYQSGFGNHFKSEALAHSLPQTQHSPQKVPHGLYAEHISGSSFLAPRSENLKTWVYRILPSVLHSAEFKEIKMDLFKSAPLENTHTPPTQLRWSPMSAPKTPTTFIQGLVTFCANGNVQTQQGSAIHLYACNTSMEKDFFYNADGDFLIVPQDGDLFISTELGCLEIKPSEIALIPRGIKFQVKLQTSFAKGYVCENYGKPFQLPTLGVIGANGLAYPEHFLVPEAFYEEVTGDYKIHAKFQGKIWECEAHHSPLDVVAWSGNYVPYKYDLTRFQAINTVSFDHPDPSIFTVLTSPSSDIGMSNVDFVIFPSRWSVAENTFRPPYYHRNLMSEFMGLITGTYDAKPDGCLPGGASLHNCMTPHGPDTQAYTAACSTELKPSKFDHTLAIMFESRCVFQVSSFALQSELLQKDYLKCWQGLNANFKKSKS